MIRLHTLTETIYCKNGLKVFQDRRERNYHERLTLQSACDDSGVRRRSDLPVRSTKLEKMDSCNITKNIQVHKLVFRLDF